jgi:flagellar biosynthesis protein FlhB
MPSAIFIAPSKMSVCPILQFFTRAILAMPILVHVTPQMRRINPFSSEIFGSSIQNDLLPIICKNLFFTLCFNKVLCYDKNTLNSYSAKSFIILLCGVLHALCLISMLCLEFWGDILQKFPENWGYLFAKLKMENQRHPQSCWRY